MRGDIKLCPIVQIKSGIVGMVKNVGEQGVGVEQGDIDVAPLTLQFINQLGQLLIVAIR